ncbi:hypothetical protein CFN79_09350 [Chromobacterium vaccinii]|uniref:restriction endonuclease n=1 Tax=Chromobacterium vaccinii TaxID=1108595 RepID=UPI000CE98AB8|nr:restriction endonuclease [Chromobacterium vaccinii]AVG16041.1 hypothetical protein CFN79_09350 [Chromobacterium vaccinii]
MAADPIIHCLEQLTDYREFEKLCCALLASQTCYPQIDPMGGTDDGGRDAIVRDDGSGKIIAFAFTVRKDWLTKLKSDSERLDETQNKLDKLVFVCTSQLNANEKDKACKYINDTYGWHLDLFDQARLRALLVQPGSTLIKSHPSIFTPSFFAPPAATQRNFAQQYLDRYASLFQAVASSTEHLAVEIDREMYKWIDWVVQYAKTEELTCYDTATLNALTSLHNALAKIYGVISDEHYICPNPNSWRIKFNNRERSDINVQAVLAAKKVEILPYLKEFRVALKNFAELSKNSPSTPASW